ncbi:uncharacterized protein LOC130703633 [Daphnia carinata]|uniref:uncharacterized protein LOC130703633 n=1 Tax=Daphnia carinata TaxID=120202 RepID=UPI00257A9504|nr:uncharacterized protein LOC130703633 [Daphnia carinata]
MLGVNPPGWYFQQGSQQYNHDRNPYPLQSGSPSWSSFPPIPFHNQSKFTYPNDYPRAYPTIQHIQSSFCYHAHSHPSFTDLQTFYKKDVETRAFFPSTHGSWKMTYASQKFQPNGHCVYHEQEADWFDFDDETTDEDFQTVERRFDLFPVPEEPVLPIEKLTVAIMDDFEFYCDDENFIQVYTDGSFINGRYKLVDSVSAIGVWFGPNHKLNVSQPTRLGGYNSDGAELEAIIEAIKIVCSCGVDKVQVNTDSKNSVRFVTYFISKWEANGWRNIKGFPVRNQNLIRQLYHYSQLVTIKWNYVPSCGGVRGNIEADRLARIASAACATASGKRKSRYVSVRKISEDRPNRMHNRKLQRYSPY